MNAPVLAPSILAGDHAHLASVAERAASVGLTWLHVDIMDGRFVPNLTFGPQTVADLRKRTPLFLDTHLMLAEPDFFIEPFAKAGSNLISIHIEAQADHRASLHRIRSLGCQCGIVLNPGTPADAVQHLLHEVDLVLVMTVQPGFGGQPFREDMVPKMGQLATWRRESNLSFRLEVDGGIDLKTAAPCRSAGVDTFVAGTSFAKAADPRAFVQSFLTAT
ncbi:ribulose-phosphate 3-epimerase [Nibricoccus sp. IMCC34717]|uniref:ribulose-phosphate 3-epimerase n=1 Tax=Nibricoccus sp. IMCC34717 TaxID=3034021 RepID=UPI00384FCB1B